MVKKILLDILKYIVECNNREGANSIPHSDDLYRELMSMQGLEREELDEALDILKEAHKILVMEIVKDDERQEIEGVHGYVEADLVTIKQLKAYYEKEVANVYEEEYHERKPPSQAIRELFMKMHLIANSSLGHLVNKAVMLGEYETLLEKEYREYSPPYKEAKLEELLRGYKGKLGKKSKAKGVSAEEESEELSDDLEPKTNMRAVDSKEYNDFSSSAARKSLNKVLSIYGFEFFFKVNLRKYNFDYIRQVVESGEITKRSDLNMLKDMVQKVKANAERDPKLKEYSEEIYQLERSLSRSTFRRNQ